MDRLKARRPQAEFIYQPTVRSTMTEAARLIEDNDPRLSRGRPSLVLAEEQTAGLGRHGRSWHSEAFEGIYCSVLLRAGQQKSHIPVWNLAIGLAVASAIRDAAGLICDLRWPNDILAKGGKLAGILLQLTGDWIIAGIGINVSQTRFPQDLRTSPTSLLLATGRPWIDRDDLLIHLLDSIDYWTGELANHGVRHIFNAFADRSSYVMNRRVLMEENGLQGLTAGLDENGFLLVRMPDGHLHRVTSGGIRPVEDHA